ncbi:MAG: STAS domain-containing protein [Spirochaetes bacterium]|nr:STAS domain-containing protein [Spirochaetota bacterium]
MKRSSVNNVEVITLDGRIDQEEVEELETLLDDCLSDKLYNVCLDMINVKFISSRALGLLNKKKQEFKKHEGDIKLVIVDEVLLKPFQITMLDTIFEIFESRRECVNAFY